MNFDTAVTRAAGKYGEVLDLGMTDNPDKLYLALTPFPPRSRTCSPKRILVTFNWPVFSNHTKKEKDEKVKYN